MALTESNHTPTTVCALPNHDLMVSRVNFAALPNVDVPLVSNTSAAAHNDSSHLACTPGIKNESNFGDGLVSHESNLVVSTLAISLSMIEANHCICNVYSLMNSIFSFVNCFEVFSEFHFSFTPGIC
jgi:hypothetical protein